MEPKTMNVWGHDIITLTDEQAATLKEKSIYACQIAEGGAMGFPGGVFIVTSAREIYYTNLCRTQLSQLVPQLESFDYGLMGHMVTVPKGFNHVYLGMGNHLLVSSKLFHRFTRSAKKRMEEHPETILYNLWLDAVLEVIPN